MKEEDKLYLHKWYCSIKDKPLLCRLENTDEKKAHNSSSLSSASVNNEISDEDFANLLMCDKSLNADTKASIVCPTSPRLSHSKIIAQSLGIDDVSLQWTSDMETPVRPKPTTSHFTTEVVLPPDCEEQLKDNSKLDEFREPIPMPNQKLQEMSSSTPKRPNVRTSKHKLFRDDKSMEKPQSKLSLKKKIQPFIYPDANNEVPHTPHVNSMYRQPYTPQIERIPICKAPKSAPARSSISKISLPCKSSQKIDDPFDTSSEQIMAQMDIDIPVKVESVQPASICEEALTTVQDNLSKQTPTFQSANGTIIKTKPHLLEKARQLFAEDFNEDCVKDVKTSPIIKCSGKLKHLTAEPTGFQTAGGKPVEIKPQFLNLAKKLFEEISEEDVTKNEPCGNGKDLEDINGITEAFILDTKSSPPIKRHRSLTNQNKRRKLVLSPIQNRKKIPLSSLKPILASSLHITIENALQFKFNSSLCSFEEIQRTFYSLNHVNPDKLISGWFENHYKLILMKLAGYERLFKHAINNPLNANEMLKQLKYRYNLEVIEGKRSAIHRIAEQDDIPQKTMVLFIADIQNQYLLLSDGWYCVKVYVDNAFHRICMNKIRVGVKLVTHGAELIGNPPPCHPLQSSMVLKIATNMVRRCVWHTKLGYQPLRVPKPTPLHVVVPDGGIVATLKIWVCRKYPLVYMEKRDNTTYIHNIKMHSRLQRVDDITREKKMEELYEKAVKRIDLEGHNDNFNEREKIQAQIIKEMELRKGYNAIPMLKIGVEDSKGDCAVVTVWRPTSLVDALDEGKCFRIHYLNACPSRNGLRQFSASKRTEWHDCNDFNCDLKYKRVVWPEVMYSEWGEIDAVGMVVNIIEKIDWTIYLTDEKCQIMVISIPASIMETMKDCFKIEDFTCWSNLKCVNLSENTIHVEVTPHTLFGTSKLTDLLQQMKTRMKDKKAVITKAVNLISKLRLHNNAVKSHTKEKIAYLQKTYDIPSPLTALHGIKSPVLSQPFRRPFRSTN